MIPYTERHFQRVDKLLQKSFIVDYTLHRMDKLKNKRGEDDDEELATHPELAATLTKRRRHS
jgi:hypothetical protein